ncbi:mitochondrial import receptor subunit tom20 [Coemansia guatemalensis]|uniref:Histone-lysine N-methyltransferase SET5 n=1 Tax=Coemansia guatemalensis TaxID=2761395 RepID=A0A9W8LU41_9FUNG|nr:mitochondrial import receptor subunit tom20 [Coemansia guatemalensis]
MVTGKQIAVTASVTAVVAAVGYAAYFDYNRRNNPQFRRRLRRDRKKAEKTAVKISKNSSPDDVNELAQELLKSVADDKLPESPSEKERYFMANLSKGEALCQASSDSYPAAACCFYLALRVYPNPMELVMIYQKSTPEMVFRLVMSMMAHEARQKQARYFDVFPPKDKNVQIRDKNKSKGKKSSKDEDNKSEVVVPNRALFTTKEFAPGDTVYEEDALVSTLLPCAQNGQFCYHCMKLVPPKKPKETRRRPEDLKKAVEKEESKEQDKPDDAEKAEAKDQDKPKDSEKTESEEQDKPVDAEKTESEEQDKPVDAEKTGSEEQASEPGEKKDDPDSYADAAKEGLKPKFSNKSTGALECDKCHETVYCSEKCRQDAYDGYHQILCPSSSSSAAREFALLAQQSHELSPILIAKFFGILLDNEKKKELKRVLAGANVNQSEVDEYTIWEHLECMRYLELIPTSNDSKMLKKLGELLNSNVPGLTEFVTNDRYTMLKGKLDYNAYAVHSASGVEVPSETEETHVSDTMRDDHASSAVGISLYLISSHITHDCDPNAQMIFPRNTNKAAIKALKPIAADEELRVSFVDPSLDVEARRKKLQSAYRLECPCSKCKSDLAAKASEPAPAATPATAAAATDSTEDTATYAEVAASPAPATTAAPEEDSAEAKTEADPAPSEEKADVPEANAAETDGPEAAKAAETDGPANNE